MHDYCDVLYLLNQFNVHFIRVSIIINHQVSNIRGSKYLNLNVSRLVLQFSLLKSLNPGAKSRMDMQLEQRLY